MPRRTNRQRSAAAPRVGPIRPGSPLYRILQMIARAIVQGGREDGHAMLSDAAPRKGGIGRSATLDRVATDACRDRVEPGAAAPGSTRSFFSYQQGEGRGRGHDPRRG